MNEYAYVIAVPGPYTALREVDTGRDQNRLQTSESRLMGGIVYADNEKAARDILLVYYMGCRIKSIELRTMYVNPQE
jgi:hypothetical protein